MLRIHFTLLFTGGNRNTSGFFGTTRCTEQTRRLTLLTNFTLALLKFCLQVLYDLLIDDFHYVISF